MRGVCSLLVITWFPACVVIHEKYVVQTKQGFCARRCCGCLFPICGHQWGISGTDAGDGASAEGGKEETSVETDMSKLRGPERFFSTQWHPLIRQRPVRLCIIGVFATVAVVGTVLAGFKVQVTKKPTTEAILKKTHPLQKTFDLLRGVDPAFRQPDSSRKELGFWAYGLDQSDPIDRSGTNPLGNGPNGDEISFEMRSGVARFSGVDLASETFQSKVVDDCGKIEKLPSVFRRASDGKSEVYCFMRDFKTYLESNGRRFPVPRETLVDELLAWHANASCTGLGCFRNKRGTGVAQGREDGGLYNQGTGFKAEGKVMTFAYIGANLTVARANLDMALIVPEYEEWRDSALKENSDQPSDLATTGLTGRAMWIATMNALVTGVIQAIPTSVGLSFLVLTVTTANWWVAALATITIVGIMGSFFLTFVAQGQTLGVYESMFLSLTAGFAVDYVVHLAHAYNEAATSDRSDKMHQSLTTMGVSVLSGAISTLMASMMLFVCSFNFFSTYGGFIFFVIFWSFVWAMCFFPAIMITFGPDGNSITLACSPCQPFSTGGDALCPPPSWTGVHHADAKGTSSHSRGDRPAVCPAVRAASSCSALAIVLRLELVFALLSPFLDASLCEQAVKETFRRCEDCMAMGHGAQTWYRMPITMVPQHRSRAMWSAWAGSAWTHPARFHRSTLRL